jgi:acetyl-CoA/propionyl-CoA carboxylase biotin carboxyl carrier protein
VQILADTHGNVVHLGERECSLQRRHQKVVEEAPSPLLDAVTRARIGEAACNTARSVDYTGAGTVEFIVSADRPDEFFFMEMNTRLQVEHPVTEMVTGLDLVEWQVRIAAGEPLGFGQEDITLNGHAIEARIYAEDPARGFLPTGGHVADVVEPSGPGVRVDSGVQAGTIVGSDYDPMLAKVIAHAADRAGALRRLDRALADTAVLGVVTNVDFVRFLLADDEVVAGALDTGLLDRRLEDYAAPGTPDTTFVAAAAHLWLQHWSAANSDPWSVPDGWRVGAHLPTTFRLTSGDRTVHVGFSGTPAAGSASVEDGERSSLSVTLDGSVLAVVLDGRRHVFRVAESDGAIWLADGHGSVSVREVAEAGVRGDDAHAGNADITSPMPGAVIAVAVESGAEVAAGETIVVVEAMKMEHSLTAPVAGTVELFAAAGEQVKVDQLLARVTPHADTKEATE